MPRRRDSDDECEIDDALQKTFYYEPKVSGKKMETAHWRTSKAPQTSHTKARAFPTRCAWSWTSRQLSWQYYIP